jgi:Protein of unknown function (DUF3108)
MRDFHSYLDRKRSVRGFALLLALIAVAHWGAWMLVQESLNATQIEKTKRNQLVMAFLRGSGSLQNPSAASSQELPRVSEVSQVMTKPVRVSEGTRQKLPAAKSDLPDSSQGAQGPDSNPGQNTSDSFVLSNPVQGSEVQSSVSVERDSLVPFGDGPTVRANEGPTISVNGRPFVSQNEDSSQAKESQLKTNAPELLKAWTSITVPAPESKKLLFTIVQGDSGDGSTLGSVALDFVKSQNIYSSRFAIRFNWATRLLVDDREWLSTGTITERGLQPIRFTEKRGKRPERVVEVDVNSQKLRFADSSIAYMAGLQDRVSVVWQLGSLARVFTSDPSKLMERDIDLPLIVSSKIVQSRWRAAFETISLNETEFETVHFVRTDARDDDLRFEFWLAVREQMSPIKIRLSDSKGRKFELLLQQQ